MQTEVHTVTANGLALSVAVHRPQASQTVLMLHGYLDQGRSMDALAQALGESYRCIAPDWRGHGRSARAGAGGSYHIQDHARDLDVLWDVMGLAAPVVVAHSMGGNVAIMLLGSGARSARGLALLDTLGPPSEPETESAARLRTALEARRRPRSARVMADATVALERLLAANPHLSPTGAQHLLEHATVAVEGGLTWAWEPSVQGSPMFRYTEAGVGAFLKGLTMPVMVVRGTLGMIPPREGWPERYGALADLRLIDLQDVGHHLHVDATAQVAQALTPWMAGLADR